MRNTSSSDGLTRLSSVLTVFVFARPPPGALVSRLRRPLDGTENAEKPRGLGPPDRRSAAAVVQERLPELSAGAARPRLYLAEEDGRLPSSGHGAQLHFDRPASDGVGSTVLPVGQDGHRTGRRPVRHGKTPLPFSAKDG